MQKEVLELHELTTQFIDILHKIAEKNKQIEDPELKCEMILSLAIHLHKDEEKKDHKNCKIIHSQIGASEDHIVSLLASRINDHPETIQLFEEALRRVSSRKVMNILSKVFGISETKEEKPKSEEHAQKEPLP